MSRLRQFSIALVLGLFACSALAVTITEAAFTERVAARLRAMHNEIKIEALRPLEIRYSVGDADIEHFAYLNNAYQAYRSGHDLDTVVETYATATVRTLEVVTPSLENIVPVIKDDGYVKAALARRVADTGLPPDQALYSTPYTEGLAIVYAVDTPANIQYLSLQDFNALSVSEPELRKAAIANLGRVLPELTLHGADGLYMFTAGGNYESSILLIEAVWSRLAKRMSGKMVVGIPSRDVLLVADSADREAVARLTDKVREIYATGNYTLTPDLYERVDGGWKRLIE